MKRVFVIAIFMAILGISTIANAALQDNGGGLIYDTDLNITWYNAPAVSRNWNDSMTWAASLSLGGVTGWRLPHVLPVNNIQYNISYSYNGSTDNGSNVGAPGSAYPGSKGSEMAYLYYTTLGNKSFYSLNGVYPQSGWGFNNKGFFENMKPGYYWSGTAFEQYPSNAWLFSFGYDGQTGGADFQTFDSKSSTYYALAVHEGNVGAPVPIPAAVWLLGTGLVGLIGIRRKVRT